MSYAQQRTLRMAMDDWDDERLNRVRRDLESRLTAPLAAAGCDEGEMTVEEVAAIRYRGQSYAIEIAGADLDDLEHLNREFLDRHRDLYGFATAEPWELVSIRLRVSAPRANGEVPRAASGPAGEPAPERESRCTFDTGGPVATPRYPRANLHAGHPIAGPAVVEDAWSTVVVPPGAVLVPDKAGNLHVATGAGT